MNILGLNIKKIIIGFSHSTKSFAPFSWGLRAWDHVPYSHVYFKFHSDKYDIDLIYQASSTMLNYMSEDVFLGFNAVVKEIEIEVTDEQYNKLMLRCIKSAGLKYGTLQIIGVLVAEVAKIDKNIFSDPEKYHCSEWVAEELEELGYKFNKPLDLVKPIDIYKVL